MQDTVIVADPLQITTQNLSEAVKKDIEKYLSSVEELPPNNLYSLVREKFEKPLLEVVMRYTGNNQVKAAQLLGIARGTLRTRLKKYDMLD